MSKQGLFFHLRTAREELKAAEEADKKAKASEAMKKAGSAVAGTPQSPAIPPSASQDTPEAPASANNEDTTMSDAQEKALQANGEAGQAAPALKTPLEYVEEIASNLKTAFPLVALSIELVCDQISSRFKAIPDEDIFRLISALLQDGLQQFVNRAPNPEDDGRLPKTTAVNVGRFAGNLPPTLREEFKQDFISSDPTLREYVVRLQRWRDKYERILDRKPRRHPLENLSHWLVEYRYQTFEDIEVPGQYLTHDDNNRSFTKISYFHPKVDIGRTAGAVSRRLTIIAMDGTSHPFSVQLPSGRGSRREEKLFQFFRMLNG